jgi:hypothetical protein
VTVLLPFFAKKNRKKGGKKKNSSQENAHHISEARHAGRCAMDMAVQVRGRAAGAVTMCREVRDIHSLA